MSAWDNKSTEDLGLLVSSLGEGKVGKGCVISVRREGDWLMVLSACAWENIRVQQARQFWLGLRSEPCCKPEWL